MDEEDYWNNSDVKKFSFDEDDRVSIVRPLTLHKFIYISPTI